MLSYLFLPFILDDAILSLVVLMGSNLVVTRSGSGGWGHETIVFVVARVKNGLGHRDLRAALASLDLFESHLAPLDPSLDDLTVDVSEDATEILRVVHLALVLCLHTFLHSLFAFCLLLLAVVVLDGLLHLVVILLEGDLHDVDNLVVAERV